MQVWVRANCATEWSRIALTQSVYGVCVVYGVSETAVAPLADPYAALGPAFAAVLLRGDVGPEPLWFLLVRREAQVFVNGARPVLGLQVLCHRDEIVVLGADTTAAPRLFFSTEELAEVVPFPGSDAPIRCARCKQPIEMHQKAVRCPAPHCGRWHHQDEALPCWEYGDTCASCDRSTKQDAGFLWTPEAL